MSDEKLEAYIKTIEPNFNSHLEKGTIEMSNEYFNLLEERMARLINKNQSLKKQLEELEEENFNLRENLYIEKMSFPSEGRNIKELIEMPTYEDLLNQQKEFIDYLENEKDRLARECSHIYENSLGKTRLVNEDIFNEVDTILSKYKSIIGGKDE